MDIKLEDFIDRSRKAQTVDELFSEYALFMEAWGFNKLAYAIISDHSSLKRDNKLGITNITSLNGWEVRYEEQNYISIDPLAIDTFVSSGIFDWSDYREKRKMTDAQVSFFAETENLARLFHGASFSVHGAGFTKGVAIACTDQSSRDFHPRAYDVANLATNQYHSCYLTLMAFEQDSGSTTLSVKEKEVLQWTANGLTKIEIGFKMGISAHTVDFHVRNILKKMGARNTVAALAEAIKKGLIAL